MSASQYMVALTVAQETRLARADAKRRIRMGELSIAAALELPELQTMSLTALLETQTRWGHVRAERMCRDLLISPWRHLTDLTDRQRRLIVDAALASRETHQFTPNIAA